jgi:hypothetical protein
MSVTNSAAHSGEYSLTSDSNNTGLRKWLDEPFRDSIAGLEFYLMATHTGQTNFLAALTKAGTSGGMLDNGFYMVLGIGIDKSDSLLCTFQKFDNPQADSDLVSKTCGALELNKWYKCTIEYDFTSAKATYSVDGRVVFSHSAPGIDMLDVLMTMRDGLGAPGQKDYYIDDITLYKR